MTRPEPNPFPDNVFYDGRAVSWNGESDAGNDARLGVIQAGFKETFPIPSSGERIWLHEPTGKQTLEIKILDPLGKLVSRHALKGAGEVFIAGGYDIEVTTPLDQGEITYICDYPGIKPGEH